MTTRLVNIKNIKLVEQGEPYTAETVEMLCLNCPLADCNEEDSNCLIKIARRRDRRLGHALYYRDLVASYDKNQVARRAEQKREAARRHYWRKKERKQETHLKAA